jgi:UDP-galactopyranose mutase
MENINPDILNRVKINLVDSSDYFPNDKYTGFCASGYADLVKKMLKHKNIKIHLHKKINSSILKNKDTIIVNTGMIDELFNFKYGKLSYRSVKFNFVTGKNNYKYTVLNTPADKKYTRFSNYGSFGIINKNTVLAKEYPMKYDGKNIPSYPITFNKSNLVKLDKYNALANKYKNLYMLGRLANFKYIDMDDSIFNAFALAKKIIELK